MELHEFELQQMRKQGSGTIVNCSSLGGLGEVSSVGSTTPPARVIGFTKSAALEYAARAFESMPYVGAI